MAVDWVSTAEGLPPEGVVVETRSPGGMVQELQRIGALWFVPTATMYVYYTPEAWRATEGGSDA